MANKKKLATKTKSVARKTARKTQASKPGVSNSKTKKPNAAVGMASANDRFVKDLLVRGDAAAPNSAGQVSRDATHAIVSQNEDGTAVVKRVRYKLF